jgi:hypothetical protein
MKRRGVIMMTPPMRRNVHDRILPGRIRGIGRL